MRDLDKLEYVHHVLQETGNGHIDIEMVEQSIEYIEDMRKPLIYKTPLISEDGEPPLTPAEQAFNSYMGSQQPTQADGKTNE